jgi:arylsulfatase
VVLAVFLAVALAVVGLACGGAPPEPAGPRPHILLITADALRADHLSFNGYPRKTSPDLDALAARAWNFTGAVTVIPKTGPSFATTFTGRHPREHGVRSNANRVPESLSTVAERLRDAGYRTAAFVSNPVLSRAKGYARGFDTWTPVSDTKGPAAVSREFLLWGADIEAWQQPTFVWLHYIDPHGPYDPPPNLLEAFLEDEWSRDERRVPLEGAKRSYNPSKVLGAVPRYQRVEGEDRVAAYVARYDAEILAMDRAVGLIFRFLHKHALEDTTAVVFTSDHGESLGEHDYWFEHGWFAFEPSLRVPLLIREPGQETARRVDGPVSNLDLRPTLLAFAGLPDDTDGRDLLGAGPGAETVVIESSDRYPEKYVGTRSPRWKYLRRERDGAEAIYDLARDPAEEHDLAARDPARLEALRRGFERAADALRPVEGAGAERGPEDAETRERLRALGYLDE